MKPFGRRIHIKPELGETLIVSPLNPHKILRGSVLEVGPDVKKIKKGDKLLFTIWGIDEIEVEDEKYYFLLESDEFILAVEGKSMSSRKPA